MAETPGDADTTETANRAHNQKSNRIYTLRGYSLPGAELSFGEQLALLGFDSDDELEHLGLAWRTRDGSWGAEITTVRAAVHDVADLLGKNRGAIDLWFGVNPVLGPPRRFQRGKARDVVRLAGLPADLDVKKDCCPDIETALNIIDDLADVLCERPIMVTHSGHGLQAIWAVDNSNGPVLVGSTRTLRPDNHLAAQLLKRWGRLVVQVAAQRGCKTDPVFDLSRVLRVAGSVNNKFPDAPVPVLCLRDRGQPLSVDQLLQGLEEAGIGEESPRRTRRARAAGSTTRGLEALLARRSGRMLVRVVAAADDGNRNNLLHWAACRAVEDGLLTDEDSPIWADLADAAGEAGLEDDEIDATLRSALCTADDLEGLL